ncbi:peroxisomal biogenesis factor 11-domain-containing protein [Mycotypha africana]|uniref:peroxisomal biogenesis factor 11-domain-containing protein n=1 Tax=Mycotypha africana TaxID=64632 RepID=UPI0023010DFB|nr:peroxisomal biogenesis factor 11-domain-containing protein [Mycotypha africana]KAI8988281.1 peroxisomal biogenesis factor 11-domain-containing protein [Mycotypha africana]
MTNSIVEKINGQQQQNIVIPCYALSTPSPPPEPEQLKPQKFYYTDNRPPTPEPTPPIPLSSNKLTTFSTSQLISRIRNTKGYITLLQKLLKDLDGRDKLMKIIQYFIKILLHYQLIRTGKKEWPSTLASHFSLVRKILRLGTGIGPLKQLLTADITSAMINKKTSAVNIAIHINELVNNVSDDIYCLYKMGIVGSYLGAKTEVVSAYCWFMGILIDLRENITNFIQLRQKILVKQDNSTENDYKKLYLLQVSIVKLLMDGIFCGCDIWKPKYSAGMQVWAGFFSGALSGYKLCIKFSA